MLCKMATWCRYGVLAWACLTGTSAYAHAEAEDQMTLVRIKTPHGPTSVRLLRQLGYELAGVNLEHGTADVLLPFAANGIPMPLLQFPIESVRPYALAIAPDQNYKTPAELEVILQAIADDHPGITRLVTIGTSGEGRPIWAIKISDQPNEDEAGEPSILFNAQHHAREVMTNEVALDTIEVLVNGYGNDPKVTHWVDSNAIWIVPMLNPDGVNRVFSGKPMWRKNTRNDYGTDINRNYPYAWNSCRGSSGSTWSDSYRGPSAGSEPETQALMGLVRQVQPVFDISYHSFSEIVLYPYSCEGKFAESRAIIEPIGQAMAKGLGRDSGRGSYAAGTPWQILYSADGTDMDWMFHEEQVTPFAIEINDDQAGFQPPFRLREPTVKKLRSAWTLLLDRLDGSGVHGLISRASGSSTPKATISVKNLATGALLPLAYKERIDGSYHIILNPGRYELVFTAGARQETASVTVGSDRVELDVSL